MEAARMTFYLPPHLLLAPGQDTLPPTTGRLVWVAGEAPVAGTPPAVHPALLVQTASGARHEAYVELVPHLPADDPLLCHMALVLQAEYDIDGLASRLYAESLATALAIHFLRRYAASGPPAPAVLGGLSPAKLSRTIAYIQAHLEDTLPLAILAAMVQMSPNHFAYLFKQATGQTPHHYILGCRIARAKQLLAKTDLPLSTIGLQVGCTDQSYFTALFRKHVAMTPKAYRAATQRV
jgi:AraC family transcriptional regulator